MTDQLPPAAAKLAEGLCDDEIHVWSVRYERATGRLPLRQLLAGYLHVSVDAVEFRDAPHGRPELAGEHGGELAFNWSHSGGRALVAVARSTQPGIDLEHLPRRAGRDVLALAQRFFAPVEAAALLAAAPEERTRTFLRQWTIKEAVLKAEGRGLAHGLHRVVVDVGTLASARLALDDGSTQSWNVRELPLEADWVAAVAWLGAPRRVRWCGEPR